MDKGEKFLEKEGIEDILMDFDKEGELICCSHLIDKALNEQLTIHSVSQQRELLNSFAEAWNVSMIKKEYILDSDIDRFIEIKTI